MKTVVGAFPSMAEAERVARDLEEMGIDKDEISVIAGNESGAHNEYLKKPASTGAAAASGASFGGGVASSPALLRWQSRALARSSPEARWPRCLRRLV